MRRIAINLCCGIFVAATALPAFAAVEPPQLQTRFMYQLSSTTGTIPYSWATVSMDRSASELYVASGGVIDIFNDSGMSVFDFANETGYGTPFGVAALDSGELLLLTFDGSAWAVVRANFRGDPIAKLPITGIPADFEFVPSSIAVSTGKLYLADKARMRVVVAGLDGKVSATHDFVEMLAVGEKQRDDAHMRAFDVDPSGNMLFTISALFSAYVFTPNGKLRSFGIKGSTPGKFNVVAGITADADGHIYVTDTLRCVVMVFDALDFGFLGEFGNRGTAARNLIAPLSIAASAGKVYVAQSKGGIKVFGVQFE